MSYNCPKCSADLGTMVPQERLTAITKQRDEALDRAGSLEKRLGDAEKLASSATALSEQVTTLQTKLESATSRHARDTAYLEAGLKDPSTRQVFDMFFDQQRETGEKDPAKWLSATTSNVEQMPTALRALWRESQGGQAPSATPQAQTSQAATVTPTAPDSNAGAREVPGSPKIYTAQDIERMSLDEFKTNYAAIAASNPNVGLPAKLE